MSDESDSFIIRKPVKVKRNKTLNSPEYAVQVGKLPEVKPGAATSTKFSKIKEKKKKFASPDVRSMSVVQNPLPSAVDNLNVSKTFYVSTPKVKRLARGVPYSTPGTSRRKLLNTTKFVRKGGKVVTGTENFSKLKGMKATTEKKTKRTVKETTKTESKAAMEEATKSKSKAAMEEATKSKSKAAMEEATETKAKRTMKVTAEAKAKGTMKVTTEAKAKGTMKVTTEAKAKTTMKKTAKATTQAITETKAKTTMKKTKETKTTKKTSYVKDSNTIPGTSSMKIVKKKTIAGNKIKKAKDVVNRKRTGKLIDDVYEAILTIGIPRVGASSQAIKTYVYNKRQDANKNDNYKQMLHRRINLLLREALENGEITRPARSKIPVDTISATGRFILPQKIPVQKERKA